MTARARLQTVSLLVFVLGAAPFAPARDFMERPRAVVFDDRPGFADDSVALFPVVYSQTALDYQLFRNTPEDKFQIGHFTHYAIADAGRVRASIYYATFLFSGPVNPGDTPGADAARWMMNAIQFEYGVLGHYLLGDGPGWTLVGEFGRRSYHPVRGGGWAEPAADILRGGIAPPVLTRGATSLEALFRVSWSDIYDFWGSDLPLPRVEYQFHHAYELRHRLVRRPRLLLDPFALVMVDTNLLRSGSIDNDLTYEAGIAVSGSGGGALELYIGGYESRDTEQREERTALASLLGWGLRFSYSGR